MFTKKNCEIVERFYICTTLPIIVFNLDGEVMSSAGYTDSIKDLFWDNDIYSKAINEIESNKVNATVTLSCPHNIFYTACYIDPNNTYKGLFILGPHSCIKNHPMNIPYKPKCLMPNLVSFLQIIERDINQGKQFKSSYSFHVKKALDYIGSRYNEDITLLDITSYLNINKSYFCSIFKRETGKTFTESLNEVRIEKSKDLLLEDCSSMLDIALSVGFNNQNYYNIMFKKLTNMTPLQFKNAIY